MERPTGIIRQNRKGNDMETINIQGLSEKVYLCLDAPTEEEHTDHHRGLPGGLR